MPKTYKEMKHGETQICTHCGHSRERSMWFLGKKICDWCIDNNRPCGVCNKLKPIVSQFESRQEVVCVDCKNGITAK